MATTINAVTTGSGGVALTGDSSGVLGFQSAGTTYMTMDTSGNLGIGTISPSVALSITKSNNGTPSPTGDGIHLYNDTGYAIIQMNGGSSAGSLIDFSTSGTDSKGRILYNNTSNYLTFSTNNAEVMRIDSSGNVGIGTSSPSYKLDVQLGSSVNAQVKNTGASGYAQWKTVSPTTTVNFGSDSNGGYMETVGAYSNLFYTNGLERMRIDSNGNVLVGATTTPSSTIKGFGVITYASGYYLINAVSTTGSVTHFSFTNPNGQVGHIDTSGSATSYVTSSDYRLKENIAPMTGALDTVSQLKPVTYNWKVDGAEGQGFIAHELQAVVPDCVSGEKDAVDADGNPIYQGIDTSFLVATLTAAIQELKAEVDELKAQLGAK